MIGNPAGEIGLISSHGHRLIADPDGIMRSPESGFLYKKVEPGVIRCLDLDEKLMLPPEVTIGSKHMATLITRSW
jgi:UDP-2-acetamido-3-amino-2,3-dideoxy-glucuronate N-acetyltransferase